MYKVVQATIIETAVRVVQMLVHCVVSPLATCIGCCANTATLFSPVTYCPHTEANTDHQGSISPLYGAATTVVCKRSWISDVGVQKTTTFRSVMTASK